MGGIDLSKPPLESFYSDLIITSNGFGLLRKALYENMGAERAKAFLIRFGRDLGISKANELKKHYSSVNDLVKLGSEVHSSLGHISALESNGDIIVLENGMLEIVNAYGKWFDSFEAKLHLDHYGISTECSCHTLSGFASGYLSTIYGKEIFVKETICKTMGYPECVFEVKLLEEWIKEEPDNSLFNNEHTIYQELELTYDKLLSQKSILDKISNYHSRLTNCVAQDNSLYNVLLTAYEILGIPIIIQNTNKKMIATVGITEEEYFSKKKVSNKTKLINQHNDTVFEKVGITYQMTTPIFVDNKIFATCSFLYNDDTLDKNDYIFLERLSSVASLCFLKEKISFESAERLKISILDRLINQQYTSVSEITSQLKYITNNIESPYFVVAITCSPNNNKHTIIDTYDQLLQFSKAFKLFYIDCLLTQTYNEIIVLIYNSQSVETLLKDIEKVVVYIQKENPTIQYKLGISSQFSLLTHFATHLQQAKQAVLLPRDQMIIQYSELGLLGNFLSQTNIDKIKLTAKKELGDLLNPDSKNNELLYTLYIFLLNGKHLEKTMKDLSLSMGGIQYRIRRIEDITNKNLKDFYTASYLLLLIESMITIGEVKWEIENNK